MFSDRLKVIEEKMQLFVRGIDNHTVEINENANLGELKV